MNKLVLVSTVALALVLAVGHAEGRGGGGRGGGGFHGGGGGGGFGGGGRGGGGFGGGGEFRGGGGGGARNFGGGGEFHGGGFGGGGSRPATFHPATEGRGNIGGRDSLDFGSRPSYADRGNNINRNNLSGNNINRNDINRNNFSGNNINRNNFNRNNFNANNWNHNFINHNDWRHGDWNNHWNHPWYNRPWAWWGAGMATGLAASAIPWGWGYYGYSDPYYVASDDGSGGSYDYSQPILAQSATASDQVVTSDQQGDTPTAADKAGDLFAAARQSFEQNNYSDALAKVNQAIALVPNDPSLHEFRGLVLFATKQYKAAAGAIYAVLSAGPGWDWTTLSGLYPSVEVYTAQLRALEAYCKQHPNEGDARFLLAYQYLTDGATDAAVDQFKQALRINPKDQLSAQLVASLTSGPESEPPKPATPKAPATPVTAASLVGSWKAARPDGSSITLDLAKDAKFDWKLDQQKKSQNFNGTYTVADNLLVLNQNSNPAMVGQVTSNADRSFNFKLVGASPNDPGLTFRK